MCRAVSPRNAPLADGIQVRRALARQVGQEHQAFAPGGHRGRLRDELVVAEAGLIAPPPERAAGRERHREQAVLARHRVGERVDAPDGSIAASSAWANSTPLVPIELESRPGRVTPVPIAAAALSPPPAATGMPAGSPTAVATSSLTRPARSGPSITRGSHSGGIAEGVEHLRGPGPRPEIQEERAGGVGGVGRELPGQAEADVVLGQQHVLHRANPSGSSSRSHRTLGAWKPVRAGLPGDLDESVGADRSVISSHWRSVR